MPSAQTKQRKATDRPHLGKEGESGKGRSREDDPELRGNQGSNKAGSGQGARKN